MKWLAIGAARLLFLLVMSLVVLPIALLVDAVWRRRWPWLP